MGMELEQERVRFEGVVYEDAAVPLRDFLQARAPESVIFDFRECEDLHMAVVQMILAYRRLYRCEYRFADAQSAYRKVIEGFDPYADDCSQ